MEEILDFEESNVTVKDASLGLRFVNNLIDGLFIQFGIGYLFEFFTVWLYNQMLGADPMLFIVVNAIFGLLVTVLYYSLAEGYSGRTLGKLITGTKVVTESGEEATMSDCILRSLSRLVPFEAFSFLGSEPRGWHDRWTKTRVVKASEL